MSFDFVNFFFPITHSVSQPSLWFYCTLSTNTLSLKVESLFLFLWLVPVLLADHHTDIFSNLQRLYSLSSIYNIREMVTNVRVTIHKDTNTTVTDFEILKDRLNTWVWSVKAGADQSQQRRHGEMGLAWWRRYGVGSSEKLSHCVIAAESLSVSRLSLSLSCLIALRFSFLFFFCFSVWRLESSVPVPVPDFHFWTYPLFFFFFIFFLLFFFLLLLFTCGLAGWVLDGWVYMWAGRLG